MDILSSQANLAGYKAVVDAFCFFQKAIPMMMTAAGTISAAKVLVVGAGVAGLQAIATAKRMGAIVYATDVRLASKEQVESLGGKFLIVEGTENLETDGGYAKEASEDFKKKQEGLLKETLKKIDIVICTALIPGKKAPIIIKKDMIDVMQSGSVIYDLAASQGGNSELTKVNEVVESNGVKIMGEANILNKLPTSASNLYAKNIYNFINNLFNKEKKNFEINLEDEIIEKTKNKVMEIDPFIFRLSIFILSIFVGYYVVWSVTPSLHTPLMSVTNAISSVIIVGAIIAALAGTSENIFETSSIFGFLAIILAAVNIFGGFLVTQRMLQMYKKKKKVIMSANLSALFYLISGILFILALRGLSSPETSRQGNYFGIAGMAISIIVTFLAIGNFGTGFIYVLIILVVGGSIGAFIAFKIPMTAMPELVAGFHSLVGLAAVFVAISAFLNPEAFNLGVRW